MGKLKNLDPLDKYLFNPPSPMDDKMFHSNRNMILRGLVMMHLYAYNENLHLFLTILDKPQELKTNLETILTTGWKNSGLKENRRTMGGENPSC